MPQHHNTFVRDCVTVIKYIVYGSFMIWWIKYYDLFKKILLIGVLLYIEIFFCYNTSYVFFSVIQKELRLERYNHEKEKYSEGICLELIEIDIRDIDNNCGRICKLQNFIYGSLKQFGKCRNIFK